MSDLDVRVLVWPAKDSKEKSVEGWLRTLISRAITFFTGMPYTHAGLYIDGFVYESTVWQEGKKWKNGARKVMWKLAMQSDAWEAPSRFYYPSGLTESQKVALKIFAERTVRGGTPYNFLQLFLFMIVYPTRWFWDKIGWVPFSNQLFGATCAVYVDELLDMVNYDVFPERISDLVVPGDYVYLRSKLEETAPLPA